MTPERIHTPEARTDALEKEPGHVFLETVQWLNEQESAEAVIAREELARLMAANPERFIPQQVSDLVLLYKDRSDRQVFSWTHKTEDVTMFVSRTADESRVDEQYAVIDTYGPMNKNWRSRTYAITIRGEIQPDVSIVLDEGGETVVRERLDNEWQLVTGNTRQERLADFFFESLRATAMQLGRSPEERATADEDALAKLQHQLYGGRKVVSAMAD